MNDDRNRILDLLASGKITAEEAARLLDALETGSGPGTEGEAAKAGGKGNWSKLFTGSGAKTSGRTGATGAGHNGAPPKFMYVKVVSGKGDNVNVKIPLNLVRAGLKLTSLIPQPARDQMNKAMLEKGMSFDLNDFKPEDLEELIEALREMEIDVDSNNGDKVRVYAE
jgi:hypothetical protein